MRYAQIANGAAVTFLEGDPAQWPDLVAADVLRPAGPEVQLGWVWDGAAWAPPSPPPKAPISVLQFRRRLTTAEVRAITLAASMSMDQGDATLQVWLDDLNRATEIDLDDPELHAGLAAMVAAGLLPQARVDELLA